MLRNKSKPVKLTDEHFKDLLSDLFAVLAACTALERAVPKTPNEQGIDNPSLEMANTLYDEIPMRTAMTILRIIALRGQAEVCSAEACMLEMWAGRAEEYKAEHQEDE